MMLAKTVWVYQWIDHLLVEKMGRFGHNQLLVTGQVGLCTSDGSDIICFVNICLIIVLSH